VNNARTPANPVKAPLTASAKDNEKKPAGLTENATAASTSNAHPAPSPQPEIVAISLPTGKTVKVPSLIGMAVRQVVEQAALAGLNLHVEGRGLVRSQQPEAGAQVPPGSQIVVNCAR
jgi:hypothetical protein